VRILLVEDSPRVTEAVGAGLSHHGHAVTVAGSIREANRVLVGADSQHFDIAVVDIGLPDGSGLEWCRAMRASGRELPILLLTARSGVGDRVSGLDAGADDYLCKPFSMDELLARMRALGRRGPRWEESVRRFGAIVVDSDQRTVTVALERLLFTTREFDIVALLASRRNRVVPRDEILEAVWGDATERAAASLDVLIARIRRKFAEHGLRDVVRTVRHVGYAWEPEPSKND
jgi:DNA-binding response OmpR family regulator